MFTAHNEFRGGITWDDDFTGNPVFLEAINALIDAGARVPTIAVGPNPVAASEPEWVAWYTARHALEDFDLEWSEPPPAPRDLFLVPPGTVA